MDSRQDFGGYLHFVLLSNHKRKLRSFMEQAQNFDAQKISFKKICIQMDADYS